MRATQQITVIAFVAAQIRGYINQAKLKVRAGIRVYPRFEMSRPIFLYTQTIERLVPESPLGRSHVALYSFEYVPNRLKKDLLFSTHKYPEMYHHPEIQYQMYHFLFVLSFRMPNYPKIILSKYPRD